MKLAIVGSRQGIPSNRIERYIHSLTSDTIIISGGAKGVDSWAAYFAQQRNMQIIEILPDYATYQQRAPLIRNLEIAQKCDQMTVFWNGISTGSLHVARCADKLNKPVQIINFLKQTKWKNNK